MKVLTQVWRPCRDVIFHVWLKQTIRIFLPCKFTAECTNKTIFIILEVGIFQNQNCDLVSVMVCHLPAICSVIFQVLHFPAVIWSAIFQVLHFPAMRFGPSFSRSCIFQPWDLVRHFPGSAFSSLWSFLVRHFQLLQIQRPQFFHLQKREAGARDP